MNKFQQIIANKKFLAAAKAIAKRPIPSPEKIEILKEKKAAKIQARENFRLMKSAKKEGFYTRSFEKQKTKAKLMLK